MRRRPISDKYHSMEAQIEPLLDVEVYGYCIPGHAPITNRAPEDCDPGEPSDVEDFHVYLVKKNGVKLDITNWLHADEISNLKDDLMEDHCDYDDNDAAYEASVGK